VCSRSADAGSETRVLTDTTKIHLVSFPLLPRQPQMLEHITVPLVGFRAGVHQHWHSTLSGFYYDGSVLGFNLENNQCWLLGAPPLHSGFHCTAVVASRSIVTASL
jgi:hypothetical protein